MKNIWVLFVNRNIIFLVSIQLYKGLLDSHTSNLEDTNFKHLLSELSTNKLEGIDNYKKFNYKQLPPKKYCYSSLRHDERDKSDEIFLMNNKYT